MTSIVLWLQTFIDVFVGGILRFSQYKYQKLNQIFHAGPLKQKYTHRYILSPDSKAWTSSPTSSSLAHRQIIFLPEWSWALLFFHLILWPRWSSPPLPLLPAGINPPITVAGKRLAPQIEVFTSKPCLIQPSVREQPSSQGSHSLCLSEG